MEVARMRTAIMTTFLTLITFAALAIGQQTKPADTHKEMMSKCKEMMQRHEEMQQKMKQMDDRLADLTKKMNDATGTQKIDAMANVINEMINQRNMMHEMMMQHQPMMMHHMAEHMQSGKASMMHCPMMKEMPKGTETEDEHQH